MYPLENIFFPSMKPNIHHYFYISISSNRWGEGTEGILLSIGKHAWNDNKRCVFLFFLFPSSFPLFCVPFPHSIVNWHINSGRKRHNNIYLICYVCVCALDFIYFVNNSPMNYHAHAECACLLLFPFPGFQFLCSVHIALPLLKVLCVFLSFSHPFIFKFIWQTLFFFFFSISLSVMCFVFALPWERETFLIIVCQEEGKDR